jgi:hypothetical protein
MQQQRSSPLRFLSGMQLTIPSAHLVLNGFHWRYAEIGNQLDRLLECWLTDPDEMRLQNWFQIHRQKLLTFLDYTGVPQTNNTNEQAVRISVNPRKVTNGFRADWGAKASADLLSVISTSKTKGGGVIKTLVNVMGPEFLPWLNT